MSQQEVAWLVLQLLDGTQLFHGQSFAEIRALEPGEQLRRAIELIDLLPSAARKGVEESFNRICNAAAMIRLEDTYATHPMPERAQ